MENQIITSEVEVVNKYAEFTPKELLGVAKFRGYKGESQKREDLETFLDELDAAEAQEAENIQPKLGRKVDPNSERQKRLAEAAAGGKQRGRKPDPTSPSHMRKAELEARKAQGLVMRGRPAVGAGNGTKQKHTVTVLAGMVEQISNQQQELIDLIKSDPAAAAARVAEIEAAAQESVEKEMQAIEV